MAVVAKRVRVANSLSVPKSRQRYLRPPVIAIDVRQRFVVFTTIVLPILILVTPRIVSAVAVLPHVMFSARRR
jgi:hypothetical protein